MRHEGKGFNACGAKRFTEAETKKAGFFREEGYKIMGRLLERVKSRWP
jgi:hypothetical protein